MSDSTVQTAAKRIWSGFLLLAVTSLGLNGCFVPPMASMQSARCMDKGQHRIAPYATSIEQPTGVSADLITHEQFATDYGFLLGFGTGRGHEFQIRFDRFHFPDDDDGYNFTSIGPKFGVVEDVFAILVPVGLYWEGAAFAFDTIELHPGAILTIPAGKYLEINTAGKFILPINRELPGWYVVNLGVSLSSDVDRCALIPEIGFAWQNDERTDGMFVTYGLAVAFYPRSDG